jgi:sporulation protein YlmC with PRC-barrel domain
MAQAEPVKNVFSVALGIFCLASCLGCAQTPQIAAPAAETSGGRLDARWSSAVVGMPVQNAAGKELGRVQDVVADGYGHSAFAIVSYAGTSGSTRKYAAIPWTTVAEMLDRDKLVVDQPVLENAPALAGAGADARNGAWRRDSELYWRGKVASSR